MKEIYILFLILCVNIAYASDIVVYDPLSLVVSNRVIEYKKSVNTPDYSGNPNTLINPTLLSMESVNMKYWKVIGGTTVIEMNASEKTAVDNVEAATQVQTLDLNLLTEDLSFDDAGSDGATEQDWIEVNVGGNTGYIRVYANK